MSFRFIDFTDKNPGNRLKNKPSRRHTTIHSQLIEVGFLNFARSAKANEEGRQLFPDDHGNPRGSCVHIQGA